MTFFNPSYVRKASPEYVLEYKATAKDKNWTRTSLVMKDKRALHNTGHAASKDNGWHEFRVVIKY